MRKRKFSARILSVFLAMLMFVGALPTTAFAAPASDIPKEMLDNVYLDALAYTGYGVQAQKNDGTIFKVVGSKTPSSILSGIGYDYSYVNRGTETVADSSTVSGVAPNIAKFRQNGLCCASYTSYVYFNYLPNVAGIDVSQISQPANLKSAGSWNTAANEWVSSGTARRITFTQNADGGGFKPTEEIPIGSLVIFKNINGGGIAHVALYAGCYNGVHLLTHVGNDNGPEINRIDYMSKGDMPEAVAQIVVPYFTEENGAIEVYKKSTNGKNLGGAVFVATNEATGVQYKIGPTDATGYAITMERLPYGNYIVKETVFPANHRAYGQTEWRVTVSSQNDGVVTIHAVNEEIPGACQIIKTSEDGVVDGIPFRITGNGVDKTMKTANGGKITLGDLKPGVYTVTEGSIDRYEPQEVRRVTVISGQTSTVSFSNILKRGDLRVVKSSEDNYKEGMKFHLSGKSISGIPVDEYAVTDSSGVAVFEDVLIGNGYVLEEVDVDIRYVVPEKQTATIEWNTVTEKSFENILKKFTATLTKSDSEKGLPQGDATLENAIYGIFNDGQLVDTYSTDINGSFTTKEYICGPNWTIREITPSNGYLLDETTHKVGADAKNYTVEHNAVAVDVDEDVIKGCISLIKHTDDGSTQIETPEKDAEFLVYLQSAGSYENAKETERDKLVCDEYGFAKTKDLPFGTYVVEQTSGWPGRELLPPFEVEISQDGFEYRFLANNANFQSYVKLVKKDVETGKTVPVPNTAFRLKNPDGSPVKMTLTYPTVETIEVFYTNSEGYLVTPQPLPYGKGYACIEEAAPEGYVINRDPVYFDITEENSTKESAVTVVLVEKMNMAQKGVIEINKKGEVFWSVEKFGDSYQPVYKETGLPGSVFKIFADEDIYTRDGTLRAAKGTLVDTIETDSSGHAASTELYLGRYKIVESQAAHGTVLDPTPMYAELTYAGQEVAVTSTAVSKTNERQKVSLRLAKLLAQDDKLGLGGKNELAKVTFGLFAAETLTAADGTTIPEDGMLETVNVQETGSVIFKTDLPFGKFYIRELTTDSHYQISDQKIPVEFTYAGGDIAVVEIDLGELKNEFITGDVMTTKYDKDYPDNKLSDAEFGVYADLNGNKEYDKDIDVYIGAMEEIEKGSYRLNGLIAFGYFLHEEKAPAGFVRDDAYHYFEITENGEVVQVSNDGGEGFANRKIKGTAATTKVDASNPDNKLPGALFEIYRDTNGDGLYTDGVDELVGEMTETETGVYKMTDLEADCYFLYERQAPESFIRDERYYAFLIEEDGKTVWIENEAGVGFINQPEIPDIPDEPENPDQPSIPQTGDNSKLWVWFILAGASSAAIVTVTIVSKKRKVRGK